jgi:preprotein translocase subunit SecG
MTLFIFLTVIQALVAAVLVLLVLMQRSEGGGLGVGGGGSPGGFMSARGAADFLTRATKWTAVVFVLLAIVLAGLAVDASGTRDIDQSLDRSVTGAGADPLAGQASVPAPAPVGAPTAAAPVGAPAAAPVVAPGAAGTPAAPADPLENAAQ